MAAVACLPETPLTTRPSPRAALPAWALGCGVAAYVALRLALLPADDMSAEGFWHDSAYVGIVAENLLAGRGYVNDAHWLVFLNPEALPVPYHNANPLYPTLVAGVMAVSGRGPVWSGFAISAASSGFLLLFLLALLRRYGLPPAAQLLVAAAGTFFSPVFETSLAVGPDALCLALTVGFLAFLVRSRSTRSAVLAGALFGLAWLTRSSVILVLPAVAVYLVLAYRPKAALGRGAAAGLAALLVALPWLAHTAAVWGSPWRSDASYYLLQDYHARAFGGSQERFWHSTEMPPSLGELLRREPVAPALFALRGVPRVLYQLAAAWTYASAATAALFAALVVLSACLAWTRAPARAAGPGRLLPELAAVLACAATEVLVLALRPYSFEQRYLVVLAVFFALLLMAGAVRAAAGWRSAGPGGRALRLALLGLSAVLWLGVVPWRDASLLRQKVAANPEQAAYLALCREMNERYGRGAPVVVGFKPYFYTLATAAPALSIPESDDAYLLSYMRRYGARYLLLTRSELAFWRPHWLGPDGPPAGLRRVADLGTAVVFERRGEP